MGPCVSRWQESKNKNQLTNKKQGQFIEKKSQPLKKNNNTKSNNQQNKEIIAETKEIKVENRFQTTQSKLNTQNERKNNENNIDNSQYVQHQNHLYQAETKLVPKGNWQVSAGWENQFQIKNKIITKIKNDGKQYQVINQNPLTKSTTISLKIKKYGQSGECIGFGLLAQGRIKQNCSGRVDDSDSLGFWTWKNGNSGWINSDGDVVHHANQKLFVKEGQELKIELNLNKLNLTFVSNSINQKIQMGENWNNKKIYVFVAMFDQSAEVEVNGI